MEVVIRLAARQSIQKRIVVERFRLEVPLKTPTLIFSVRYYYD